MFNPSNTILILGDSPFLSTIEDKLLYILARYTSLGINRVILKQATSYHIFVDFDLLKITNAFPQIPAVSLYSYGDLVMKEKELYNTFSFNINEDTEIIKKDKLAWCGFTHDFAISYAIMKGYENIVLVGAADFVEGKHYSTEWEFKYAEVLKSNSKKFIEDVCCKKVNIFTCNMDSVLNIPFLTIDELLK